MVAMECLLVHTEINISFVKSDCQVVAWPSGLRRWFKAPVISMAWVRIPPLPIVFLFFNLFLKNPNLLIVLFLFLTLIR